MYLPIAEFRKFVIVVIFFFLLPFKTKPYELKLKTKDSISCLI